jgi:polar amino acid transport system substrate-binding protein
MLQVVQYQRTGEMLVEELPAPACMPGGVLVRTVASLISAGTERSSVESAQQSLLERARSQPEQVKAVLDKAKKDGIMATYEAVKSKLESFKTLGYSAAGIVIESRCEDFVPGDRVACAGAQYAHHAEIISVPKNLCCKIPEHVSFDDAAYTTLGAIALQGVRQADIRLGETVAVIGLGLLGQLTVQLLKASGCRVVGLDINEELFPMALEFGCEAVFKSSRDVASSIKAFTRGLGTDAVIITASTDSTEPIMLALDIARKKSPIVIVGAVPMNIPRSPFYEKELELRISCSYGPGRYDPSYEAEGHDYPIGYVRWTENRNMQAFLECIERGILKVAPMTTHHFPIEKAMGGYELITGKTQEKYLGIILTYPERKEAGKRVLQTKKYEPKSTIGIGFIGAGSFAQTMLIPPLKSQGVDFISVSTGTPVNAKSAAQKYGFSEAATDSMNVITHDKVSMIFCASRHDSHARYVQKAVEMKKPIFVEKPLCITREELEQIDIAVAHNAGRVMVGFNRRFSDSFVAIKKFFAHRSEPMSITYRVNAGFIPKSSWIQDPAQGGRIIGEGCHFIDCMAFLTGSVPIKVHAEQLSSRNREHAQQDNVSIIIRFADGSVGTLLYLANGDGSIDKEYCEVFCEGKTAIMNNFRNVILAQGKKQKTLSFDGLKGHREEIVATVAAIKKGESMPIDYATIRAVTLSTIAAVESLQTGIPIEF